MHEFPITMSILSIVLEQAKAVKASKITKINLIIGELSYIVPEYVEIQFDIISRGTIAFGARLLFNQLPIKLRCRTCATIFSPRNLDWVCPNCQEQKIDIVSGRECYISSMEVD